MSTTEQSSALGGGKEEPERAEGGQAVQTAPAPEGSQPAAPVGTTIVEAVGDVVAVDETAQSSASAAGKGEPERAEVGQAGQALQTVEGSQTAAPVDPVGPSHTITVDEHQHVIEIDYSSSTDMDYDSLYGSDHGSATTSLTESVKNYQYENGRRYNGYKMGAYLIPNDEVQQEQLDLFHHVFLLRLGGKLFLAPIENPQKIMDVGTGTGIWAIQVGEDFPGASVMGNDLSPIQPNWVPPNVSFEVDDFNEPWLQTPGSYDFIHSRDCHAACSDWSKFVANAYRVLRPGGWYESQEHTVEITTDDGSVPEDHLLKKWVEDLTVAFESLGKTCHPHAGLPKKMEEAGFVNIKQQYFKLPIGTWPKEPAEKEIGAFNLVNMLDATEGFSMAIYTRIHGKTPEEASQIVKDIKKALKNKNFHMYFRFAVTYGQKPLDAY